MGAVWVSEQQQQKNKTKKKNTLVEEERVEKLFGLLNPSRVSGLLYYGKICTKMEERDYLAWFLITV